MMEATNSESIHDVGGAAGPVKISTRMLTIEEAIDEYKKIEATMKEGKNKNKISNVFNHAIFSYSEEIREEEFQGGLSEFQSV